ncbi:MAG: hypothetical protein ACTSPB_18620 [Candidatus Thorarchaeota archaeon]
MAKKYFKKQQRKKEGNRKVYSDGRHKPTGLNPNVIPTFRAPDYELPIMKEEVKMTADVMNSILADHDADGRILDKDRFVKVEP